MESSHFRRAFRFALGRTRGVSSDVHDEIAHHLDLSTERLIAEGLAPDQARAEAERRLMAEGDPEVFLRSAARTRDRRLRLRHAIEVVGYELRHALRALRKQPGITALVVVTLALGIGANAAIFPLVDRLLFRTPPGIESPGEVHRLYLTKSRIPGASSAWEVFSCPEVRDLREAFADRAQIAAFMSSAISVAGDTTAARRVGLAYVTENFLPLLGVRIALGRHFATDDNRLDRPELVAIISYDVWQSRFGGDSALIGQRKRFGSREFTIIGVTARGFAGIEVVPTGVWIPIATQRSVFSTRGPWWEARSVAAWKAIARVQSDAPRTAFEADALARLVEISRAVGVHFDQPKLKLASLISARGPREHTPEEKIAARLAGVTIVLLLVAIANVTNMLITRAMRRERELAVRRALGVSRARLGGGFVVEAAAFALLAATAATGISAALSTTIRKLLLTNTGWTPPILDLRAVAFTGTLAFVCVLCAGLFPALHAMRADAAYMLRTGGRDGGGRSGWVRKGFLVVQAAMSAVLLVGAGLFVVSLDRIKSADVGFDLANVAVVNPGATAESSTPVLEAVEAKVKALPGVEATALAYLAPLRSSGSYDMFRRNGDSIPETGTDVNGVTSSFFATMGLRVLRGREFSDGDHGGAERVIVVNETAAQQLWPGQEAIGQCLRLRDRDGPCYAVIGVAENSRRFRIVEEPLGQAFVPLAQLPDHGVPKSVLIRSRANLAAATKAASDEMLRLMGPRAAPATFVYSTWLEPQLRSWKLGVTLFGSVALLALILAVVGLYNVLAYSVTNRSHEIGVRLALGATPGTITSQVVREGVVAAGAGVMIGLAIAAVAGRLISALLYSTSPRDPGVFAFAGAALLIAATLAALIPAMRAARVDPLQALRAD